MRLATATAAAAAALAFVVAAEPASARFFDPATKSFEPTAETVACRMVRERVVRPNGRVIYKTRQVCTPGFRPGFAAGGCRMIRERVVRPNGAVVYRSVRRCG
ncbi:MAG: hypothetical protein HZA68_00910 [Rhodovulum sp.]|nr:hypothetical protein [Rhodovulum sp.]